MLIKTTLFTRLIYLFLDIVHNINKHSKLLAKVLKDRIQLFYSNKYAMIIWWGKTTYNNKKKSLAELYSPNIEMIQIKTSLGLPQLGSKSFRTRAMGQKRLAKGRKRPQAWSRLNGRLNQCMSLWPASPSSPRS